LTERTWQQDLVDLHPEMFIRTFRGVSFSTGYPSCPDGWRDIVTKLVERVSAAALGYPVHFTQILERHGRLTIYWKAEASLPKGVECAIEQAIELAEARASCSCAICGANARLFSNAGRLVAVCPDHAQGVQVPVRPGWENLHIVRRFVGDNIHSVACRRYDRVHDQFVDVDPRSLGSRINHESVAHLNIHGEALRAYDVRAPRPPYSAGELAYDIRHGRRRASRFARLKN
jgi:hypothetical protein